MAKNPTRRTTTKQRGDTVTFYLYPKDVAYITRVAKKGRLTRSGAVSQILAEHAEAAKALK